MSENVGEVDVDVNLDTSNVDTQATQAGNQAGADFDRAFERRVRQSRGFQRALQDIEHQGREGMRRTAQGMNQELDRNFFRTVRRGFRTTFADVTEGLTRFRRIALGIGAALGPIIVPLLALLAEIGPAIAIALPAVAALGGAIAVIALSMDALGEAFKPLADGFRTLKEPISDIMTLGVRPLVKELSEGLIPALLVGFSDIARVLNRALRSFLSFAKSARTLTQVRQLFSRVSDAIVPLLQTIRPLTRALLTIALAATPGFKALNESLLALIQNFNTWIQRLNKTGALQREISESVDVLIKTLSVMGNFLIGVIQGLRTLGGVFAPIARAFEGLGISARDAGKWLTVIAGLFFAFFVPAAALVALIGSLGTVLTAVGTAISFLFSPIGAIIVAIAALAAGIYLLWRNSEQFRTAVTNLGLAFLTLGQELLPVLIEAGRGLATLFMEDLLPVITETARQVGDQLAPAIQAVADFIVNDFIPTIPVVVAQFKEWWPQIRQVAVFLAKLSGEVLTLTAFIVGKLIPILIKTAKVMVATMIVGIQGLIAAFKVLRSIVSAVAGVIGTLWSQMKVAGGAALKLNTALGDLAQTIGGALVDAFGAARSAIGGIVGVFQSIGGVIEDVISAVGRLIAALGRIRVPDINLPGPGDIGRAITGRKHGGIITRPELSWIGEGPWAEAVIPDPKVRPKRALQLAREFGLDKLILDNAQPAANAVNATFNIYESGNGRGTAERIDARLRIMMGF